MRQVLRRHHFLLRRLHSLTGVLPVGGFLLFPIFENASALDGADHFTQTAAWINSWRLLPLLEAGLLLALALYAILGVAILREARFNLAQYPHSRNWASFFQRVSGVLLLAFMVLHLYHFRWHKLLRGSIPTFDIVSQVMLNPGWSIFYLLGVVSAAYHLFNGLHTFLITWWVLVGAHSQRISARVANVGFLVFAAYSVAFR